MYKLASLRPYLRGLSRVTTVAVGVALAAGLALTPTPAKAWWARGWGGPAIVIAPPVVVGPPVYAPPPAYYAPPPRPVHWVPPHWRGPYWVPGHWSY